MEHQRAAMLIYKLSYAATIIDSPLVSQNELIDKPLAGETRPV